jgi:orotate phosphoribosyltransferase
MAMFQALAPKPLAGVSKMKGRLLAIIKERSLIKGGSFKLASGTVSDYYLDMKPTTFDPEGASLLADVIYAMLADDLDVDTIGGLELGAVPIIAAVCAKSWGTEHPISGFVVRKERKGHGTDKKIDGNFQANSTVVLIDDVTTRGGSVMQAVEAVREQGAKVKRIIAIVDRGEGAAERLSQAGISFAPIFTTEDVLG